MKRLSFSQCWVLARFYYKQFPHLLAFARLLAWVWTTEQVLSVSSSYWAACTKRHGEDGSTESMFDLYVVREPGDLIMRNPLDFLFLWRCRPTRARASSITRFLDQTQRRITLGRTPLNEWSPRRRDSYLTTHNTHDRHPCSHRDSKPQSQQASSRKPTPKTAQPLEPASTRITTASSMWS
jgi:hypothetical protein